MISVRRGQGWVAAVAAALCFLLAAGARAENSAPEEIVVASDDNYPPYIFRNARGQIDGYLADAWKLWSAKTGIRVRLEATDWAKAQALLADRQAQVIDTMFRTPERERYLAFSRPYADLPVPIYAHEEIGGISGVETLRGFLVGVKAGDACIEMLKAGGVTTIAAFDSYERIVEEAAAGRIKVFCLDEPPANYLLYRKQAHERFRKAFTLYTGQFHRAVNKGDEALLEVVQRGFDSFTPEEKAALQQKWMGVPIDLSPWGRNLLYGLVLAIALGGGVAVLGFMLRRQVRQRTRQLYDERLRLRTLVDTLPDLVWLKDANGVFLACNKEFQNLFGAEEGAIVGRTDDDFVPAELADFFRRKDREAIEAGGPRRNEEEVVYASDGHRALLETIKTPMYDSAGKLIGVLGIGRDITERKRQEEELRLASRVFEYTADGIVITDASATILAVNRAFTEITGYAAEEALGNNPRMVRSNRHEPIFYQRLWAGLNEAGVWQGEIWNRRKNGEIFPVWQTISAIKDDHGAVTHYVAVFSDITIAKRSQETLEFLAHHDPLTRLPNRVLLRDRLEHALSRVRREQGGLAVLFVDLDHFKQINDTLGHAVGDIVLCQAAEAMRELLRAGDTVARIGGDEFVLLIEGDINADSMAVVAQKLIERFARPFRVNGQDLRLSASIGISLFPQDGIDIDSLLGHADIAMYQAKEGGRNAWRFYRPDMGKAAPGAAAMRLSPN